MDCLTWVFSGDRSENDSVPAEFVEKNHLAAVRHVSSSNNRSRIHRRWATEIICLAVKAKKFRSFEHYATNLCVCLCDLTCHFTD